MTGTRTVLTTTTITTKNKPRQRTLQAAFWCPTQGVQMGMFFAAGLGAAPLALGATIAARVAAPMVVRAVSGGVGKVAGQAAGGAAGKAAGTMTRNAVPYAMGKMSGGDSAPESRNQNFSQGLTPYNPDADRERLAYVHGLPG